MKRALSAFFCGCWMAGMLLMVITTLLQIPLAPSAPAFVLAISGGLATAWLLFRGSDRVRGAVGGALLGSFLGHLLGAVGGLLVVGLPAVASSSSDRLPFPPLTGGIILIGIAVGAAIGGWRKPAPAAPHSDGRRVISAALVWGAVGCLVAYLLGLLVAVLLTELFHEATDQAMFAITAPCGLGCLAGFLSACAGAWTVIRRIGKETDRLGLAQAPGSSGGAGPDRKAE